MNLRKYRVGIMFLVIMIILQLTLPSILNLVERNSEFTPALENNFRLSERVDKVVLDAFIDHIKRQNGYKIVFIGDSVVEGAMVKDDAATIPAYFRDLADKMFPDKHIRVYNLAVPGNRPSDIYFTLKKINENSAADLIIMNVNYAFYSDEMLTSASIARPDLFSEEMDNTSGKILGIKYSGLEHFFQGLAQNWKVYGLREMFSYYLFGKNPREKLLDYTKDLQARFKGQSNQGTAVQDAGNLDKPWWTSKPFPNDKITHWVQVFNIDELNDQNKGYWFLKKMNLDMKTSKIKTIAFLIPMNMEMIKELDLMRFGSKFNSNITKIQGEFQNEGQTIFDYTKSINSEEFNDLFHLTSNGNKHLAEILMTDTKDVINKGVSQ